MILAEEIKYFPTYKQIILISDTFFHMMLPTQQGD